MISTAIDAENTTPLDNPFTLKLAKIESFLRVTLVKRISLFSAKFFTAQLRLKREILGGRNSFCQCRIFDLADNAYKGNTHNRMTIKLPLIDESWLNCLKGELGLPYMQQLRSFLKKELAKGTQIFPPTNLVFNALYKTPLDRVKVVIIGQDPYHGQGQAHGLSFSVPKGVPLPPSLQNIFKELKSDLDVEMPSHGCLEKWAEQGVLLLNATLTVRSGEAKSHYGQGWEQFTDRITEILFERSTPTVFMLWGKSAQEKCKRLMQASIRHLVLTSVHPSPLSAYGGFFGCKHFSKTNEFLKNHNIESIDWSIV